MHDYKYVKLIMKYVQQIDIVTIYQKESVVQKSYFKQCIIMKSFERGPKENKYNLHGGKFRISRQQRLDGDYFGI